MALPTFWQRLGKVVSNVAVGAATVATTYEAIQSTIDSSRHMMDTSRTLVERQARMDGTTQIEALANLARRGDVALSGYATVQEHQQSLAFAGLGIGALVLLLILMRR